MPGPPQRMGAIIFTGQANSCNPLVDKAGILSRAYVGSMIGAAGEAKSSKEPPSQFEPFEEASASFVHQFELNWPSGLLLNNRGSRTNFPITNDVAGPDLHQIAAAQFAIDGEIEESPISNPPMLIQEEANGPNLTGFERSLRTYLTSCIPRHSITSGRIEF